MKALSDRIRAALQGGKSAGVSALIAEVEAAASQSRDASVAAKDIALDPLLTPEQIAQARQDAEDAQFEADRMTRAAGALREALVAFEAAEDQDRRGVAYGLAKVRRDDVADRIRARYPALANELGELMSEMKAADAAVLAVNQDKPAGAEHLATIDMVVRGFHPGIGNSLGSLADVVVLPSLGNLHGAVWRRGHGFQPDPNPEAATATPAASGRTGEEGGSLPATSPVRLVMRDKGEAA